MVLSNVKAMSGRGRERLGGTGKVGQGAQRQGEGRIVESVPRIVVAPISGRENQSVASAPSPHPRELQ